MYNSCIMNIKWHFIGLKYIEKIKTGRYYEQKWSLFKNCNCYPTAQPAGIPEILKKSLHSCSVRGGEEVFIIGKNFLKDTKVIFQENVAGEATFAQKKSSRDFFSAVNSLFCCCCWCSRWKIMEGRSWNWHGTVPSGRLCSFFHIKL